MTEISTWTKCKELFIPTNHFLLFNKDSLLQCLADSVFQQLPVA